MITNVTKEVASTTTGVVAEILDELIHTHSFPSCSVSSRNHVMGAVCNECCGCTFWFLARTQDSHLCFLFTSVTYVKKSTGRIWAIYICARVQDLGGERARADIRLRCCFLRDGGGSGKVGAACGSGRQTWLRYGNN